MDRKLNKEDRRRKYCDGLTSEYFILTGRPRQIEIKNRMAKRADIRAQIIAEELLCRIRDEEAVHDHIAMLDDRHQQFADPYSIYF